MNWNARKKTAGKKAALPLVLALLLALWGCTGNGEPSSAAPEPEAPLPGASEAGLGEASDGGGVSEANPAPLSLAHRLAELGLAVPEGYAEIVEEHIEVIPSIEAIDKAEIYQYGNFTVLSFQGGIASNNFQNQELHILENGNYIGTIPFYNPRNGAITFQEFKGTVWMLVNTRSGHGLGSPYKQEYQVWYDITHPELKETTCFTTYFGARDFITDLYIQCEPSFQLHTEARDSQEVFVISVEWTDTFSSSEEILFSRQGTEHYIYEPEGHSFCKDWGAYKTRNTSYIDYLTGWYNADEDYDFLIEYIHELWALAQNGTETQKKWVADYLARLPEIETFGKLYEWQQAQ